MVKEVKEKDVYEIKNNNYFGLHYKYIQMFLDAIDTNASERDENFRAAYEVVCNRMRKLYGMKKNK